MQASNFLENGFLNAMRGNNFGAPTQVFAALFLTSPGETGTEGIEMNYSGYQRIPIVFAPPVAENTGIGIRNNSQLTFAQSPVDAGTVQHIGIFDSVSGGNMYLYGALTEALAVLAGESPVLLINEVLFFSLGNLSNAYKIRLFNVIRGIGLQGITPHHSLWSGNPEVGGAELSGLNYARVPLTFTGPLPDISGATIISNSISTTYNRPSDNWGNWVWSAIMDASQGGEPVWITQRPTAKLINRGIMPFINTGDILLGLN